ncbi:AAA_23 domain-containing protein [Burkholderia multivorans]
MILESIAIQDFRKIADRLVIDGLEPGLNLITGPNETGKSTIAEAIRTVFLERYKVSSLGSIVPRERPDGQPTVEVAFTIGGVPHLLKKQFVRKSRCELRVGHQTLTEDEAEQKLSDLLGFSRAERGASKPEHAGIPGLLWVRQGQTRDVRDSGEHAANYVRDALAQLSGGEVSGGNDVLIDAVQRELWKLLTERKRSPTGALADAESRLSALQQQQRELDAQKRQFDDDLTRLTVLQAEFDDAQRKRPWEAMQQKADEATKRAAAFAELERRHKELSQLIELANAEHKALLQQEQAAVDLDASIASDRQSLETAQAAVADAIAGHQLAAAAVASAQKACDEAGTAFELANAAVTAADLKGQAALHGNEIARLASAVEKAEAASAAVRALAGQAAQVEVDAAKLQRLQAVSDQIVPLQARKDAALTRIEYRLTGPITIDGATVDGQGVVLLDSEKTIGLPGLGDLIVVPGVSDVSALIDALQTLEAERARLLLEMGVPGVAEAVSRRDRWKALSAEKAGQAGILALHAPNGIDALRDELAQARGRLGAAEARLAGLPDVSGALPVSDAKSAFDNARVQLESARVAQMSASERKAQAGAHADGIRVRLDMNAARVSDPEYVLRREERQAKLVEKDAHVKARTRELDTCAQALEAARLDDPAMEAQRFARSADIARGEQLERQTKITQLRAQLEAVGASGIGERLAQTAASIEQTESRHAELRLRADALGLLESILVEERDAAVASLRSPLTSRIGHYLKRVFPAGEMSVDDALTPVALQRGDRRETLESLSYGTQEQLGILSRLAYADLLQAAGRPTLLLFDDAVVHTDDMRRDGIKRALLDAATRHQILVFTCHPGLWDDLGVKQRHLPDLMATSQQA